MPKVPIPKIGNGGLSPAAKERRRKEALPGSGVGRSRTSQASNPPAPRAASKSAGQIKAMQKRAR
jgi:hypothetical protein